MGDEEEMNIDPLETIDADDVIYGADDSKNETKARQMKHHDELKVS